MSATPGGVEGGVRIGWADVPGRVRAGIEDVLGASVVRAESQAGGFSPGTADRLVTSDGRRAFAKAAGPELNERTPQIHRQEIAVMRGLPPKFPAPRFLGSYDDGDWVAIVLSDVDGRHPALPWTDDELGRVLTALQTVSQLGTPCPVDGLGTVWSTQHNELSAWPRVIDALPDDLDPWVARNLDRLAAAAAGCEEAVDGDTLVHLDIRADNLLVTEGLDGPDVVVLDWPWACRGAAWTDAALFLCSVATAGGPDPERVAATHPLLRDVAPDALTSVAAALAGYWTEAARAPESPGLPTVREFQARAAAATLAWLERRTGWP